MSALWRRWEVHAKGVGRAVKQRWGESRNRLRVEVGRGAIVYSCAKGGGRNGDEVLRLVVMELRIGMSGMALILCW